MSPLPSLPGSGGTCCLGLLRASASWHQHEFPVDASGHPFDCCRGVRLGGTGSNSLAVGENL
eukprot:5307319-Amphidinium_carterae.1